MTTRMIWAATVLAGLAVLGSLALAASGMGWFSLARSVSVPAELRLPATAERRPPDLRAISQRALFGAPAAAPRQAARTVDARTLGLVLRGVLVDSDPARSRAFIPSDGRLSGYVTGDPVAEGVRLTPVLAHAVCFAGLQPASGLPQPARAARSRPTQADLRPLAAIAPATKDDDVQTIHPCSPFVPPA